MAGRLREENTMISQTLTLELKQVLGALLFGSRRPISVADMRRVLLEVAEQNGDVGGRFAQTSAQAVLAALQELQIDLSQRPLGLQLVEVAGGFRLQTTAECAPWLRHLLELGKPSRLSRPALETLAIIAYRQPVTRAEIEAVRGVAVDTIVRHLQELQLIRMVGRSPLPGRPMLYGTTQFFLEHFGLKSLQELPGIEQLCRREAAREQPPAAAEARPGQPEEEGPAALAGDEPEPVSQEEDASPVHEDQDEEETDPSAEA